jgi:hypothetical protein
MPISFVSLKSYNSKAESLGENCTFPNLVKYCPILCSLAWAIFKSELNVACGVRGFFDHVWIKFSAPAISFVTTNIVSMFFLVLLFLLRIFFLYINKRFDGEYYFLFILAFSTIFLYPIAIKTWCVNLRHAYDEIVNYLPILILVYIWIGNILSKYFNQKYFIIFIFILFILSNLIQLIIWI